MASNHVLDAKDTGTGVVVRHLDWQHLPAWMSDKETIATLPISGAAKDPALSGAVSGK
jgi:hypothetical protein